MSRLVRQVLFVTLIACHAAVTLCGPCLHALPGSSHQIGAMSKADRPDHPAQSRRDAADNCVICHFVAQGQLLVESASELAVEVVADLAIPALPTARPTTHHLPSSPRAPPLSISIGS
ncbi:MAG TPA: hypothetical protein VFF52_21510 [Isosphaeraceae bacterium]|nr:hypothetical protein [Isosphaeraceae bacterium]